MRSLSGFAVATAVILAAFYGCTSYGNDDEPKTAAPEAGAAEAAASPVDAASDAVTDAGVPGADAEASTDASTCPPCDCDRDGYQAIDCTIDSGLPPGDCDDLDPRRHPDAGFRDDAPGPTAPPGDWDCSGAVDRLVPPDLKCKPPSVVSGFVTCNGGMDGFVADPACGATADLYACPTGSAPAASDCFPKAKGTSARQQCK